MSFNVASISSRSLPLKNVPKGMAVSGSAARSRSNSHRSLLLFISRLGDAPSAAVESCRAMAAVTERPAQSAAAHF